MTSLAELIKQGKIYDDFPARGNTAWYGWVDIYLTYHVGIWCQEGEENEFQPLSLRADKALIEATSGPPLWVLSKPFMAPNRVEAIDTLVTLTNKEIAEAGKTIEFESAYVGPQAQLTVTYKLVDMYFNRFEDLD